jgi:hypothetical protein
MDRMTKILLAAIAIGLWANLGLSLFRPVTAVAQDYALTGIANNLSAIANGVCVNGKIC